MSTTARKQGGGGAREMWAGQGVRGKNTLQNINQLEMWPTIRGIPALGQEGAVLHRHRDKYNQAIATFFREEVNKSGCGQECEGFEPLRWSVCVCQEVHRDNVNSNV